MCGLHQATFFPNTYSTLFEAHESLETFDTIHWGATLPLAASWMNSLDLASLGQRPSDLDSAEMIIEKFHRIVSAICALELGGACHNPKRPANS
jgi:hypothetical protein